MICRFRLFLFTLLSSAAVLGSRAAEAPAAKQPDGWDYTARTLADDALLEFRKSEKTEKDPAKLREIRLGLGVALLNSQPKTEEKLDEAVALFAQVQEAGKTDNLGVAARYYTARISERHRYTTDPVVTAANEALAAKLYTELFADAPTHLLAQLGMVKYAILTIYKLDTPTADRAKTLEELELILPKITIPIIARDFHNELGNAYLYSKISQEKALQHFLAVDKIGIQRFVARADLYIKTANLARSVGKKDIAIAFFTRFVKEYPRDTRNFYARQLLTEMGAPAPAESNALPAAATPPATPAQPGPATSVTPTPAPVTPAPAPAAPPAPAPSEPAAPASPAPSPAPAASPSAQP